MKPFRRALPLLLIVPLLGYPPRQCRAATLSGTVAYSGSSSGRIYLSATPTGYGNSPTLENIGVSIPAPGAFTISGLQSGTYALTAYMDVSGAGNRHANDPAGQLSVTISDPSETKTGVTLALSPPTAVPLTVPTDLFAVRGKNNRGAFVGWDAPRDGNGLEIPTSYTISWSKSSSGSPVTGSRTITASDGEMWLHNSSDTTAYYYRVTANLGGTSASTGWVPAQSPPGGSYSIGGTVTYGGVTPTGPLFVAAVPFDAPPQVMAIATPAAGSSGFTIPSLPNGSYGIYAFLDMNSNGVDDAGDYRITYDNGIPVTVAGSNLTGVTVPLPTGDVVLLSKTDHQLYGEPGADNSGEFYGYSLSIQPQKKTPVNATLISAPQVATPVSMGSDEDLGAFRLDIRNLNSATAGETHRVRVTYADGSSAELPVTTSAPLLSPPAPLAPVFAVSYPAGGKPLFRWNAPLTPPPSRSYYELGVFDHYWQNQFWEAVFPPSATSFDTSATDGTLPQALGVYNWNISLSDINDNSVSYQATFYTAATAPVMSSIYPATAQPGGTLTIRGYNLTAATGAALGGVTLPITSQSATQLTVSIPADFFGSSAQLALQYAGGSSTWPNPVPTGAPLSFSCSVADANGSAIPGARVALVGNPELFATSDGGGNFTLTGLPRGSNFRVRITANGYQPLYSRTLSSSGGTMTCSNGYTLNSAAEMVAMGITPGLGGVRGTVESSATGLPLSGVTLSVTSSSGHVYTVKYYNGASGKFDGSLTDASGKFRILNVTHGDLVTMGAMKTGYSFSSIQFRGAAESMGSGFIRGTPLVPTITGISPSSAKVGNPVSISGTNFIPGSTTVTINGLAAPVTSASPTLLVVTVPAGASTGVVRVTTPGGTATGASFTPLYTFSAALAGAGSGTVTATTYPGSYSCDATPCPSADLAWGSAIVLEATPHTGSDFSSWSNCSSVLNRVCSITLTGDTTATATFALQQNLKIGSTYYGTAQAAFDAAVTGTTILGRAMDLDEQVTVDRAGNDFGFQGGYDGTFTSRNGTTSLRGLTIERGGVALDGLAIR